MAANLIPLQLDQTSGNIVVKTIPGSFTPPTGTGFVHVTNATLDSMAVTPTQVTAQLNLFTSLLQGLVPASGGGTSNFLRADGSWAAPAGLGVTSFNTRTGAITLTSADVNSALGYVPYNGVANPSGFLSIAVTALTAGSGISVSGPNGSVTVGNTGVLSFNTRTGAVTLTSGDVTTALGFTPYNATNPAGYISTNQTITVTGDVSGSGTTAITLTLPNITTAGTYGLVTVNAKGQVTSGTSPTTLAGYGITDGVATDVNSTLNAGISITLQGGGTIHGVPTPAVSTDAANKAYVDAVAQGLSWKAAVKAQAAGNMAGIYVGTPTFTLTANPSAVLPTIDGYAANVGDRLLLNGQTTASQNGIYVVTQTTAPWILTRSSDFNEVTPIDEINGAAVYVEQGSTFANTTWTQIDIVTTFDVSPINFTQLSSGGGGSVTSFSFINANGVTGVVTNPTSTPTLTLTLGAITPSSVAATGTVTGSNLSGTNTGDQTITLVGDVTAPGSTGTVTTTLAIVNSNVGSFGNSTSVATITVNAKGLVTAASNTAIAFPVTSVFGRSGAVVATTGDYSFSEISGSATTSQLPALTASGDATGTGTAGTGNIPLTLATVNSNVGSFTNANITVNAKGLITAASSGSSSGTVTNVSSSGGSTGLTLTTTNPTTTPSLTLAGTLVIANGGTGQTTQTAAFDALSPLTTTGDILYYNGTHNVRLGVGSTNQVLTVSGGIPTWQTPSAGSGTVTSVAFSDTSTTPIYNITGSPVTTSGTLTQTLATQPANTVFAGPTTGAAAQPTFRTLVAADIPLKGTEQVVLQYNSISAGGFTLPAGLISQTSGIGTVTANGSGLITVTFTGYTTPPIAAAYYSQVITSGSAFSWIVGLPLLGLSSPTLTDTGTPTAPGLITAFSSSDVLSLQLDGSVTNASGFGSDNPYLIIVFKF